MLRPALTLAVFVTATVCLAPQLSGARAATQKTDRRADRNSLKSAQIRISSASISTQSDADTIPRLIHQSWKSEAVPRRYERWQQSWKDLHPDWAYKLWTDVSNRALLQDHYIWFLEMYDDFPTEILRADTARYFYMYHYGGIYIDLDFMALKNHEPLLKGNKVVLGALSNDTGNRHRVPNAWMASAPGHPFWMFCIHAITKAFQAHKASKQEKPYVENITGPMMLSRALKAYDKYGANDIVILPPGLVYASDWKNSHAWERDVEDSNVCNPHHLGFDEVRCLGKYPDAFAVTFWTKSWDS